MLLLLGQVLLPHSEDMKLESIVACKDFLTVFHRSKGLQARPHPACDMETFIECLFARLYLTSSTVDSHAALA